jgi:phenylacetate-CoA ligase
MERFSFQSLYDRLPVTAQQWLVSAAGWRSYRIRFGAPFRRILQELRQSDRMDADAVRADQERRLREMVRWAATTVPYYRDLFAREGVDPDSIQGLDDLARIPYLEKETVRNHARELRSEAIPDRQIIPGHTSGTTGTALQLFHTREALGWEYAVIWRQREWFRVRVNDRFAAFGGQTVVPFHQSTPPFWRYDRARVRMLFSIYHMTPDNLEHYANELRRPGYAFWQGYPSAIALVSEFINDRGIELGDAAPRAVFTSSESLLDFHRSQIARAADAPIADRYGQSEFSVSAVQCPQGTYHVDSEFCVIEIDPHEETEDWVRGEVISTGFANRAMPFLRYRTGDVATLRKRGACPCGRARPILELIDGRIEDYVVTPDGRRIGRMDHIFKDALEVKEAQIYQPSLRRLVVRLVPRPAFDPAVRKAIEENLRRRIGDELQIEFELTDQIPRLPSGKFRAVVSEIPGARAWREGRAD